MTTSRPELLDLFKSAHEDRNILMILISQSFPEHPIRSEMAKTFQKCGILSGFDMTLPCVVTKMASILQIHEKTYEEKRHLMITNISGEIS